MDFRSLQAEMDSMGVASEGVQVAPKRDPGTSAVGTARLVTNLHGVRVSNSTIYRYDVNMVGFAADGTTFEINQPSYKGCTAKERYRLCQAVFKTSVVADFLNGVPNAYDAQKVLFTLDKLKIDDKSVVLTVDPKKEGLKFLEFSFIPKIEVTISEAAERPEIDLGELSDCDPIKTLFVDVATSQFAIEHPKLHRVYHKGTSYLVQPFAEDFTREDLPNLPEAKHVWVGAHKDAMFVEGPKGRGGCCVGVAIDTAKTAFHADKYVVEKAHAVLPRIDVDSISSSDLLILRTQLKGIFVRSAVERGGETLATSVFEINDVSSLTANTCTVQLDGKDITLAEYYQQKYHHRLRYLKLPLLEAREGDMKRYFPMEVCKIIGFQRVRLDQETSVQTREMANLCSVDPSKRLNQNQTNAEALRLWGENGEWLKNLGLSVVDHGLELDSRILPAPTISYGDGTESVTLDRDGMWQSGKHFMSPTEVHVWAVYGIVEEQKDAFGVADLRKFARMFMEKAQERGIKIAPPDDLKMLSPNSKEILGAVKTAKDYNCEFIFFVQSDNLTFHDAIKLAERDYQVVTQDMKTSNAFEVAKGSRAGAKILRTLINKVNVKLGGLNYEVIPVGGGVEHTKADRLYIGFAFSHAPSSGVETTNVAVVGYSANWRHRSEFLGDFGFQEARSVDNTRLMGAFMKTILDHYKGIRYTEKRKNKLDQVVIYREGAADSEFDMILRLEVPLIREKIKKAGFSETKVTMIVVNKLHHLRFIPTKVPRNARAPEQNVQMGTVVDDKVVHPRYCEFYLNSHKAIQGTVKTPRYTVLLDESNFTMNDLEEMTYALCFNHQIVNLSTSVPTPLYVANCYADRGRRLYNARSKATDGSSPSNDAGDFSVLPMSVEEANAKLPYEKTILADVRITA